jgi:hypothetical protein
MRGTSGWISHMRWRPVLGLVAGIVLMVTVVLLPRGKGFGQFSSDLGPAEDVAGGMPHVPSAGPSFMVLHTFAGSPTDGAHPDAGLIQDAADNLYGRLTSADLNPTRAPTEARLLVEWSSS